jgi:hypothetical protein
MRNKELVDRRFMQVDAKITNLKFMLSRLTSKEDFMKEVNSLKETVEDLKSIIEREQSPLRNG